MVDIIFPESGESVRTGVIARLAKAEGDLVKRDETVIEIETDKITVEVAAPAAGRVAFNVKPGQTVEVGSVLGTVDPAAAGAAAPTPPPAPAAAPLEVKPAPTANGSAPAHAEVRATPLARKIAEEKGISLAGITGTGAGGRVREQDVLAAATAAPASKSSPQPAAPAPSTPVPAAVPAGPHRRERLSPLRQRIAQRLVEAQHNAAMLTTFNEVDMSAVMALRARYKEDFEKKHGVGLGFMSFFVKACVEALRAYPLVNASIVTAPDGSLEVEHHDSADIAVAVSTPKGLTVPVLRNCERLSFAGVEAGIKALAAKARDGKLALDDLQGGTFTITNGGVFGSLLSTPILNAPQTAILGMHAIKNRAVEDPDKPGQIALRPMMYLAVSYDHRLLDGAQAVGFLVTIKNCLERPERMLLGM
ncbi:MAG: 2-oxoglutarate dehydrogenase complex dihydrolipoyllysine-residue succinyltransferase [Phycisphaerae bacterium]|nr:2-oxoglutarate dehydrogenase complex dihydrolipoyllysine-residue succinyltransferase [Phycisphaerae bacterium]